MKCTRTTRLCSIRAATTKVATEAATEVATSVEEEVDTEVVVDGTTTEVDITSLEDNSNRIDHISTMEDRNIQMLKELTPLNNSSNRQIRCTFLFHRLMLLSLIK